MSSLAEHEAEQAAITALCKAGDCDHPGCTPSAKVDYSCPECGAASVYATGDVSIYWDAVEQDWKISDGACPSHDDEVHCGDCGASFDLEAATSPY